jgi:hypothetical protein
MANIVPISIALAPNMLHHNNVGITYVGASNFRMELIIFVPLYFVAMLQSMVTVTEILFVTTPTHTLVGMRSIHYYKFTILQLSYATGFQLHKTLATENSPSCLRQVATKLQLHPIVRI